MHLPGFLLPRFLLLLKIPVVLRAVSIKEDLSMQMGMMDR